MLILRNPASGALKTAKALVVAALVIMIFVCLVGWLLDGGVLARPDDEPLGVWPLIWAGAAGGSLMFIGKRPTNRFAWWLAVAVLSAPFFVKLVRFGYV